MQDITELTVLSRVTVQLPDDLKLATEDFQEGWNFVRSGDVHWMDKKVRKSGWHFIWIAEPSQRGGVGQTAQVAIAGALKLALRRVNPEFNAVNIDRIEITQYPWFFIAKVRVYPYQIQQDTVLQIPGRPTPCPITGLVEPIPAAETMVATAVRSRLPAVYSN
jgi:hypothetical protein